MRQDRWMYKVINIKIKTFANPEKQAQQVEEQLNQLGLLGWELVTIESVGTSMKAFFKK